MTAIFLFLVVGIAASVAAVLATFFQVAFNAPHTQFASASARQLPLLHGNDLKQWATEFANAVVAQHTRGRRTPELGLAIARAVECGASQVLEQTHGSHRTRSDRRCASDLQDFITVTGPEVLAIADTLRREAPPALYQQVTHRARENDCRLAARDPVDLACVDCPLVSSTGECLTFAERPLCCRSTAALEGHAFSVTLGEGVSAGLTQGLSAAGLDGQRYELNSALTVALSTPNAAERWAAGEPVFAGCRQLV